METRRRGAGRLLALVPLVLFLTGGPITVTYATEFHPQSTVSTRLDAGSQHNCAVVEGGDVMCWGDNSAGQLGYGNSYQPGTGQIGDNELPVTAGAVDLGGVEARQVSAGDNHTCVILEDAEVACWGNNGSGILGLGAFDPNNPVIGDDETPGAARVNLGANRSARQIAAGGSHTCVVTDREKVMCWGDAGLGALGYGNEEDIGDDEDPATAGLVDLGTGRTVRDIAAGAAHTCAVMDNGNVFCWGKNDDGALGYPSIPDGDSVGDNETPASVGPVDLGGKDALSVAAGEDFTCVVLDTRQVRCWGDGAAGRLGSGSTADIGDDEVPNSANAGHVALGGVEVDQVVAGDDHACARMDGGDIHCWGEGQDGRLGLGATADIGDDENPVSQPVVGLAGEEMTAVTAGQFHTCAVTEALRVRCWGRGDQGALGKGSGADLGDTEAPGLATPIDLGALILPGDDLLVSTEPDEPRGTPVPR